MAAAAMWGAWGWQAGRIRNACCNDSCTHMNFVQCATLYRSVYEP